VPPWVEYSVSRLSRGAELSGEAGRPDFFISYTGVNEPWAKWIAVQLEKAGYSTVSQVLDFRPGHDFVHKMHEAMTSAVRTIAVLSPAYLDSKFGEAEWRGTFADDPTGELGKLILVKVQPCQPPGLLRTRVYIELIDVDEPTARWRLLGGVGPPPPRTADAPYPGQTDTPAQEAHPGARFPGAGPSISNLDGRNRNFTGRDHQLVQLHQRLREQAMAAVLPVEAVHGLGGVGKTELVREYGHRFGSDYDIIWWIPAEQPTTAAAALAELGHRLALPASPDQAAAVQALFEHLRHRDRWLLIYDNAEQPDALDGLLPPIGPGHVLVTSRWSVWGKRAERLQLNVLARQESVRFLQDRTTVTDHAGLSALAELLGDLPLALEEAAAYLEETCIGLDEYLTLVRDRAAELFLLSPGDGGAEVDQRRVATVWSVSLDRAGQQAPAAEALLNLFAFLGPDIPRPLPTAHPDALPADLAVTVADPLAYNRTLAALGRYSLVELGPTTVDLHRLVQAVIRARLDPNEQREWAEAAVNLLHAEFPHDSGEFTQWPACEQLLPHLLAATEHAEDLDVAGEDAGRLLDRASAYLRERGQYRQAQPLAKRALHITKASLVLKPAILAEYIVPFASKTGSTSTGKRVVVVDGYAGAGRDEDGRPDYPALIAEAARTPALKGRVVECYFVARDAATYRSLCHVLAEVDTSGSLVWAAKHGNVTEHLDELLGRAEGVPLFLFLDPFGLSLPLDVIVDIFARRPSGQYAPATEVLFRFDVSAVRRIRGVLHSAPDLKGREQTLKALDQAAGGPWWRDEDDPSQNNAQYLDWFEERLLNEITTRARCAGWTAAVKQREDLQPAYLLVFLTRHRDGMDVFGDALSKAQERWRREVFDEMFTAKQDSGQGSLIDLDLDLDLDLDAIFKRQEAELAKNLQDQIEQNLRALLQQAEQFVIRAKYEAVYKSVEGIARTSHLRKALQKLHAAGVTTSDHVGDLYGKLIIRAPDAEP
jgi:three-Cys-motif partner protein